MSEKRFLSFIFIEGIILTILSLCILILPKLTSITFGVMLSSAFIVYGLWKIIISILNRNYTTSVIWNVFLGALILVIGILLLFVPKISLLWLIALTGVYFLLESISATVFVSQIRNVLNSWGCKYFAAFILFLIGLIIVISVPVIAFWAVAILCGTGFLIKGMSKITLFLTNKNNYNI